MPVSGVRNAMATKLRAEEFTAKEICQFSVAELCQWLAVRGISEEQQEAMRDEDLGGKDFAKMCRDDDGLAELRDLGLPQDLIDEAATLFGRSRQPATRAKVTGGGRKKVHFDLDQNTCQVKPGSRPPFVSTWFNSLFMCRCAG